MTRWRPLTRLSLSLLVGVLLALAYLTAAPARQVMAAQNLTVYSQRFWFDPPPTGGTTSQFGVNFDFKANYKTDVMLLGFMLYYDEMVPDPGYCLANNGSMPPAHPGRPFWSTGTPTPYAQGRNFFTQTFTYTPQGPDVNYLVNWLIVRNSKGQVTYCAQQVHGIAGLQPAPSIGTSN